MEEKSLIFVWIEACVLVILSLITKVDKCRDGIEVNNMINLVLINKRDAQIHDGCKIIKEEVRDQNGRSLCCVV